MKQSIITKLSIVFVAILGFALVQTSNASALSASVSCSPTTVVTGATSTCTFTANATGDNITGVEANISVTGGATLGAVSAPGWKNLGDGGSLSLMSESGAKEGDKITVASFTVTAGSTAGQSGQISVEAISFTNSSWANSNIAPASTSISVTAPAVTVTPAPTTPATPTAPKPATPRPNNSSPSAESNNANLASLELDFGKLDFNKDTIDYTLKVPFETIKIVVTATAEDPKATVAVTGGEELVLGDNTVSILVTAEDGTTKTYTIIVTRQEKVAKAVTVVKNQAKLSTAAITAIIGIFLIVIAAIVVGAIFVIKHFKNKKSGTITDRLTEQTTDFEQPTPTGQDQAYLGESAEATSSQTNSEAYGDPDTNATPVTSETPDYAQQPAPAEPVTPTEQIAPVTPAAPVDTEPADDTPPTINYFQ